MAMGLEQLIISAGDRTVHVSYFGRTVLGLYMRGV